MARSVALRASSGIASSFRLKEQVPDACLGYMLEGKHRYEMIDEIADIVVRPRYFSGGTKVPRAFAHHRMPESASALCKMVSLTAAKTSRMFEVSVA